jgi:uncharacterized protein YjbJ (UPF0337 family)
MSITDKISGRVKKAAGDLIGDRDLHRQGAREERKGDVKEELAREDERLERELERRRRREAELASLERRT